MKAFSTTTELMQHQPPAIAKMLPSRVGGLFMDMGTGKSRVAIELAKIRADKFDRFIWFCPVDLKETVRYEIKKHTDTSDDDIYMFDHRTDDATLPLDRGWYIIGIESMGSSDRVTLAVNRLISERSFVCVDESTYIKGNRAKRTKRITSISQRCRYRLIMSGLPFTQGAIDLYSQMKFLSPRILGYASFWTFANAHIEYKEKKDNRGKKRRTGQVARTHNQDYLANRIAPYTYQVTKDECMTLPEKLYSTHCVDMTTEQEELYETAKSEILLNADPEDWMDSWILQLFSALQTIICGWWNSPAGVINCKHRRLEQLQNCLATLPDEKVLIWAKYQRNVEEITQALTAEYGTGAALPYYGKTRPGQRHKNLEQWRKSGRFLVLTQSSGGHGLTLNESRHAVFYANGFKYSERAQAEDRNHRIGQQQRPLYIDMLTPESIDERIQTALGNKENALDHFRQQLHDCRENGLKERAQKLVQAL